MRRGRLVLWALQAVLLTLGVLAASAIACEGAGEEKAESTTLSTKLSGESKEGEELTILEGSKAKDKATLSGKNASKATGKVTYKVYSEKECKTLVTSGGEVTVSGESVPVSSERELEGGKAYYWQAHYGGDSKNKESTSACTEILNVKAKTTLTLKLAGEGSEAEELTIAAGSEVEGKATLSGTNSSTASGNAVYNVYSDTRCETLVLAIGEFAVSAGKIPASGKVELEGGKTYYWQAGYKGDALHQESKSACGKVVLKVNPKCTQPFCEPTITPGVEITTELDEGTKGCTAGPIMTKGTELFLLTAGHCFFEDVNEEGKGAVTKEVTSAYPAKPAKEIGSSGAYENTKTYDIAEVKIEKAEWLWKGSAPPVLVEWELTPKIAPITGTAFNNVGEKTCFSGSQSGLHCGEILRTGATGPSGLTDLVETTIHGINGDSGAPEFAPGKAVLIQGVYVEKGGDAKTGEGRLTEKSHEITGFPLEPGNTCTEIEEMVLKWKTAPIKGPGIPAGAVVTHCKAETGPPTSATLTMSAEATKTGLASMTFGREELGWYEPMSQVEAKFPGQALLVK
jgi:hypothetical protein